MSTPNPARRRLPVKPSQENLRKQAKRLATQQDLPLATAQHRLAADYGCRNWAELMHTVEVMNRGADQLATVQRNPTLRSAVEAGDLQAVQRTLDAGTRVIEFYEGGVTPLHLASARGPVAMVELLLRHGAKEWGQDAKGRKSIDYARDGHGVDREAIIELLDRPVIRDPHFRAAVKAIHAGDVVALQRLLAEHPNLVRDSAVEPECYSSHGGYFTNPRLLWFVANNPNLIETMPANITGIAEAILDARPAQSDLDYTLGLVMTSGPARAQNLQRPLMTLLLGRGARADAAGIAGTLGHGERDAVLALLESGLPMTAPVAAGLGRITDLQRLLPTTSAEDLHVAFSMAVINRELEAARLCLEAGADVNRLLTVHAHSTAAHQAAVNDDVPMLQLLVAHGADLTSHDKLWNGTPLGWAIHTNKPAAEAYLKSLQA